MMNGICGGIRAGSVMRGHPSPIRGVGPAAVVVDDRAMYRLMLVGVIACGSPPPAGLDAATPADAAPGDGAVDGDPCAGASCACAIDDDCGAHAYCNFTHPGAACACVAG